MPLGYAQSGGCSERKKDPTHNKVIGIQSDACAEERQARKQSKVARFIVHSRSPIRRGSDQAAPCARVDGLEPYETMPPRQDGRPSFWERPGHALPDREKGPAAGKPHLSPVQSGKEKILASSWRIAAIAASRVGS